MAALVAFFATLWALAQTVRTKRDEGAEAGSTVRTAEALSDAVFDSYRGYGNVKVQKTIFEKVQRDAFFSRQTWEEADAVCKEARTFIHEFDVTTARAIAKALDRCRLWEDATDIPSGDEAWAQHMEKKVCSFVLRKDVFDLRPSNLHLPITLATYLFRFADGNLAWAPVTGNESYRVFRSFGYSDEEIELVDALGREISQCTESASEFVEAMIDLGVSAKHGFPFATAEEDQS